MTFPSAFSGVFQEQTLTYEVAEPSGTDRFGNPLMSTTKKSIVVFVREASSAMAEKIMRELNRETSSQEGYAVSGRAVNPAMLPSDLKSGTRCELTLNGVEGELLLVRALPSPLAVVNETLGERFRGIWKAKYG